MHWDPRETFLHFSQANVAIDSAVEDAELVSRLLELQKNMGTFLINSFATGPGHLEHAEAIQRGFRYAAVADEARSPASGPSLGLSFSAALDEIIRAHREGGDSFVQVIKRAPFVLQCTMQ